MTKKNLIVQDPIGDGVGARKLKVRLSLSRTGHEQTWSDARYMLCEMIVFFISFNRPYAYDVTIARIWGSMLGVKRDTATCSIAKHAASGQPLHLPPSWAGPAH